MDAGRPSTADGMTKAHVALPSAAKLARLARMIASASRARFSPSGHRRAAQPVPEGAYRLRFRSYLSLKARMRSSYCAVSRE